MLRFAPLIGALALAVSGCGTDVGLGAVAAVPPISLDGPPPGRFVVHEAFPSRHVAPRRVVVWLPEGYDGGDERYAVLYMHDGQNLYDPGTAMGGEPWAVDRHLDALTRSGRVRPTLVVGIWNTPARSREYAPAAALAGLPEATLRAGGYGDGPLLADGYVRFLTEELKPFVDLTYRTRPGREDTFVMGSSMGGLISLYALARRPDVFGGAGALSTHWVVSTSYEALGLDPASGARVRAADPAVDALARANLAWLQENLPRPGAHRLYFDQGTEHLDALYGRWQREVDALVEAKGYRRDVDVISREFAGAAHDEAAWRARLALPLEFLLGAPRDPAR